MNDGYVKSEKYELNNESLRCVNEEEKELNERTQKEAKMLVPESQKYVVSMFLATAGVGGHLQGSDEKETIYLVFGIIDLQNKEVSAPKEKAKRSAFH